MIFYDNQARYGQASPRTLLIYVPAERISFNLSGIYPMPPLGIAYLAAYLRKQGYFGTAILDMPAYNYDPESAATILKTDPFDIYGLSATLFGLPGVSTLSRLIKTAINPEAVVVVGGAATRYDEATIFQRLPYVDAIVTGAGEGPLWGIISAVKRGETLESIPGVVCRGQEGLLTESGDECSGGVYYGPPARDLLPMRHYRLHPPFGLFPPATTVETQRGCSYGCMFCSIPRETATRKVDDVIDELKSLVGSGYREVHFVDPTFPIDRIRTQVLCQAMIDSRINLKWTCKSRIDTVDSGLLKLMSKAGCYMISYGIESGSERILSGLNKHMTVSRIRQVLRDSIRHRIRPLAYILIGSPGETDETVVQTLDMLKNEKVAFALFGELVPDPGARMFEADEVWSAAIKDALDQLFFEGDPSRLANLNVFGASHKQVQEWLRRANFNFYMRPSYFWERIVDLRNAYELFVLANGFYHILKESLRVNRINAGVDFS